MTLKDHPQGRELLLPGNAENSLERIRSASWVLQRDFTWAGGHIDSVFEDPWPWLHQRVWKGPGSHADDSTYPPDWRGGRGPRH